MNRRIRGVLLVAALVVAAGCTSGGSGSSASSAASASAAASVATSASVAASPVAGGLLEKILKAGKLVVSTDPKYPPQSELTKDGTYQGFDIDVANEIGKRLGVKVEYVTPDWAVITAGGWGGRWDLSVGSMAMTPERAKIVDFSSAYYYNPAQMTASKASGITTLEGLAGKTVCSGESTTYDQWLNGKLTLGDNSAMATPPAGVKATTLTTDTDCSDQWKAGRNDFQGWLASGPTVEAAIKAGVPLVKVGDPVFYEPLAAAADRKGLPDADFIAWLTKTIDAMHADGTLTTMATKWYGTDYSTKK